MSFGAFLVKLLMEQILHQLRFVVYPIIYNVLYILGGCLGFLPSRVCWNQIESLWATEMLCLAGPQLCELSSGLADWRLEQGPPRCLSQGMSRQYAYYSKKKTKNDDEDDGHNSSNSINNNNNNNNSNNNNNKNKNKNKNKNSNNNNNNNNNHDNHNNDNHKSESQSQQQQQPQPQP